MKMENKGLDSENISDVKNRIKKTGNNFVLADTEDNGPEYANFYFIGMYEGKEVIYDAVIYSLRLHYESEVYEIAEHKAAQHFPEFKKIKYEEDENGDLEALDDLEEEIGLYMAEVIVELEEEGEIKVKEHIEMDLNLDYGIGLDVGLNVEEVEEDVITKFVNDFNEDSLNLDETLYTFHLQDEDFAD